MEVESIYDDIVRLKDAVNFYKENYVHLEKILTELCHHLLGPNWYSCYADSWSVNEDIKNTIMSKYKKVKK
ncbi:hypothetical protein [uncultured Methanobrevibacter sp.]|uniref:hypothetical protein n=1 Tax=uncultured Methanobrevibacter sp. TaxID=253161 RepID=UPI0025E44CC4|nr:hypothetical protein [uncultured Methanobrevibacter sp.]